MQFISLKNLVFRLKNTRLVLFFRFDVLGARYSYTWFFNRHASQTKAQHWEAASGVFLNQIKAGQGRWLFPFCKNAKPPLWHFIVWMKL